MAVGTHTCIVVVGGRRKSSPPKQTINVGRSPPIADHWRKPVVRRADRVRRSSIFCWPQPLRVDDCGCPARWATPKTKFVPCCGRSRQSPQAKMMRLGQSCGVCGRRRYQPSMSAYAPADSNAAHAARRRRTLAFLGLFVLPSTAQSVLLTVVPLAALRLLGTARAVTLVYIAAGRRSGVSLSSSRCLRVPL